MAFYAGHIQDNALPLQTVLCGHYQGDMSEPNLTFLICRRKGSRKPCGP